VKPRSRAGDDLDASLAAMASLVQRLAVLLSAGVAPTSAWQYLAGPASGAVALSVTERIAVGNGISDAILQSIGAVDARIARAWCALAAAWAIATDAGAPLAPSLRHIAESLRSMAESQREISIALAAPVATARLVLVLPIVGVAFSMALGFNTIETLTTTPVGIVCLLLGAALLLLARWWNRRLVVTAEPTNLTPGLAFDLMAIAVSGGAALDRARSAVESAIERFGLDARDSDAIGVVLELSRRAGVPAAELLRSEANESRLAASAEAQRAAAALSVTLMLPLGVCVLPAFLLLGVVPLMVSVISSTAVGL
jgi:tight adherence protein B